MILTHSHYEISESRALVHHAFGLAQSLGISTILVQVEKPGDFRAIESVRESENVLWLVRAPELRFELRRGHSHIVIPDTGLTRFAFQTNVSRISRNDPRMLLEIAEFF